MDELGGMYGALAYREVGDGRGVWIYPQFYTFKLVIGPVGAGWYTDHWCYRNKSSAFEAFIEWDVLREPEPAGWVRHPQSGRRRFPVGDPATEIIRL